jgi:hypothetical protein
MPRLEAPTPFPWQEASAIGVAEVLLSMRAPGLLWRHEDKEDHMT